MSEVSTATFSGEVREENGALVWGANATVVARREVIRRLLREEDMVELC